MRSIWSLLVVVSLVAPTFAEERVWTISTGVYTASAELVEVRGDTAYLKVGDTIEQVPFARLSSADQQYISAQSLVPAFPGRVDDSSLPVPPAQLQRDAAARPPVEGSADRSLLQQPVDTAPPQRIEANKPVIGPALRQPTSSNTNGSTYRTYEADESLPLPNSTKTMKQSNSRNSNTNSRNQNNSNPRRNASQQNQQFNAQQQNSANRNGNRSNDDRPGLFGPRSRRFAGGR